MDAIIEARSSEEIDAARRLFREYEAELGIDLCFQGFEDELRNLPGSYAPPEGCLLLALVDGTPAGCVAMRKLSDRICEMKRLYLRAEFRGRGLGNALIERLVAEARRAGYENVRLDTLPPKMGKAVELYRAYGFRPIPAYYDNPNEGVLFMELDLTKNH